MRTQFGAEGNDTIQHQMKKGMAPLHRVLLALVLQEDIEEIPHLPLAGVWETVAAILKVV